MHRIFNARTSASAPPAPSSPSIGHPSGGDPVTGVAPTEVGPYWFHLITEELCGVVADAGMTLNHASVNQVSTAIQSRINAAANPPNSSIAAVIAAAGMTYNQSNASQLSQAIASLISSQASITSFGSGDNRGFRLANGLMIQYGVISNPGGSVAQPLFVSYPAAYTSANVSVSITGTPIFHAAVNNAQQNTAAFWEVNNFGASQVLSTGFYVVQSSAMRNAGATWISIGI